MIPRLLNYLILERICNTTLNFNLTKTTGMCLRHYFMAYFSILVTLPLNDILQAIHVSAMHIIIIASFHKKSFISVKCINHFQLIFQLLHPIGCYSSKTFYTFNTG